MKLTKPFMQETALSQIKILLLNSLDARYGSTYRIRAFKKVLEQQQFVVNYVEDQGNLFSKLTTALKETLGSYDLFFTQKFNPITLPCILIARLRHKPVIVDWDDFDAGLQGNLIKKWISSICETIGPKFANQILTHSHEIFQRGNSFCPTELISQGYDDLLFRTDQQQRNKDREKWGFKKDDCVIGYMCTLTSGGAKDLPTILKTWTLVSLPQQKFFLIGGGPLEKWTKKIIKRLGLQVVMTGLIPHEEIPRALNCLDVGVVYMTDMPSNRARVSLKVIEYLAMGIPIVGKVVGETDRLFGSWIIKAGKENLADEIMKVAVEKREVPPSPSISSFQWSRTAFSLPKIISKVLNGGEACN